MNTPLPCPHCGSTEIYPDEDWQEDDNGEHGPHDYSYFCFSCGAQTGERLHKSQQATLDAWNRRV